MSHRNNFGALRLLFALLVIVAHSFELVAGEGQHDPLTYIFGTISSGELGVDGFFLVSGFLVAQSFERSKSVVRYLLSRGLRIYPGFIFASLVCLFIVGPLSGADLSPLLTVHGAAKVIYHLMALRPPELANTFNGLTYPSLNGSMWTIWYEFRCYLLVIAIGLAGLYRRPWAFGILVLLLLSVLPFTHIGTWPRYVPQVGNPVDTLHLTATFFAGSAFFVWRHRIVYRSDLAIVAALLLCGSAFSRILVDTAVAIFGGYIVFWLTFLPNTPTLNKINNETDISYGVYLYAWPIQNLLIWFIPGISAWMVLIAATLGSCVCGYASWSLIEKRFLQLKPAHRPRSATAEISAMEVSGSGSSGILATPTKKG